MTWQSWPIQKKKFKGFDLYFRGNLTKELFKTSLAVVGSRGMTQYGKQVVKKLVGSLAMGGVTIISGFMYGVDSEAHKVCIENGGRTVAVFGCGLNVCFPSENDDLYTRILETGGAVISEYEPDAKPHLWKFPRRNRIVAGLASLGVLVIEGGIKSGSMVTAKLALKAKKKLYAVPGPITSSTSEGTNKLIKEGKAKMVTEPADIVEIFQSKISDFQAQKLKTTNENQEIYDLLKAEPLSVDDITKKLKMDVVTVGTILSIMSLKGLVYEEGGKYYLS